MSATKKIAEKRVELRTKLFPHVNPDDLWLRKSSVGFTTVPRALPLVLVLMDRLSKGKPVSMTYLELWCRMFDECFITLKPREMAFHSGFSGERAVHTWTERMRILVKLGFIETQPGTDGEFSFAVILNPYKVIKKHYAAKVSKEDKAAFNALLQRMTDVGAKDFEEKPIADVVPSLLKAPLAPPPPRRTIPMVAAKRN